MRVRMKQTIDERDGDGFVTYKKGSLWNVSTEHGKRLIESGAAVRDEDTPKGTVSCSARVVSETDTCVMVEVHAYPSGGAPNDGDPPVARLERITGAQLIEGPDVGEFVPAPAVWRFARTAAVGLASFTTQCTGFASGNHHITIAAAPAADEQRETSAITESQEDVTHAG